MPRKQLTILNPRLVETSTVPITEKDRFDQFIRKTEERMVSETRVPGISVSTMSGYLHEGCYYDVQFYMELVKKTNERTIELWDAFAKAYLVPRKYLVPKGATSFLLPRRSGRYLITDSLETLELKYGDH